MLKKIGVFSLVIVMIFTMSGCSISSLYRDIVEDIAVSKVGKMEPVTRQVSFSEVVEVVKKFNREDWGSQTLRVSLDTPTGELTEDVEMFFEYVDVLGTFGFILSAADEDDLFSNADLSLTGDVLKLSVQMNPNDETQHMGINIFSIPIEVYSDSDNMYMSIDFMFNLLETVMSEEDMFSVDIVKGLIGDKKYIKGPAEDMYSGDIEDIFDVYYLLEDFEYSEPEEISEFFNEVYLTEDALGNKTYAVSMKSEKIKEEMESYAENPVPEIEVVFQFKEDSLGEKLGFNLIFVYGDATFAMAYEFIASYPNIVMPSSSECLDLDSLLNIDLSSMSTNDIYNDTSVEDMQYFGDGGNDLVENITVTDYLMADKLASIHVFGEPTIYDGFHDYSVGFESNSNSLWNSTDDIVKFDSKFTTESSYIIQDIVSKGDFNSSSIKINNEGVSDNLKSIYASKYIEDKYETDLELNAYTYLDGRVSIEYDITFYATADELTNIDYNYLTQMSDGIEAYTGLSVNPNDLGYILNYTISVFDNVQDSGSFSIYLESLTQVVASELHIYIAKSSNGEYYCSVSASRMQDGVL